MSRKLFRGAVGACSIIGAAVSAMQEEWLWAGSWTGFSLQSLFECGLKGSK